MANQRIKLVNHLSTAQLKARYAACEHPVERRLWQMVWLLSRTDKSYSCAEVAETTGVSSDWVRKVVRRYNAQGEAGLLDQRRQNGNAPLLDTAALQKLQKTLQREPPDRGLWSGPKVARWLKKECGHPVSAVTGWHYLIRLGFSLQMPRRKHRKSATAEEQEAFKKNSKRTSKPSGRKTPENGLKSGRKTKRASACSRSSAASGV